MPLTTAQQATFKAFVQADPVLSLLQPSADNAFAIALSMQSIDPTFYVYRTNMPKDEVMNYVIFANMTPSQAIPATGSDGQLLHIAKTMVTNTKQMNLQNLLLTDKPINFALPNVRAGFQDALTALPTNSSGNNQAAGWTNLQLAISRQANRLEKLLSTGTGSQASPATMGYEGTISYNEVGSAMGWSF